MSVDIYSVRSSAFVAFDNYRVSLATNSLCYYLARPTKTAMLRRLAAGSVLLYLLLIYKVLSLSVVVTSADDVFTK